MEKPVADEYTLTGSEQPATSTPEQTPEGTPPEVTTEEAPQPDQAPVDADRSDSETSGASEDAKPKAPKSRAKERIEELSRRDRNSRRQIARLNQEIGRLRAERPPREEDFADHGEYQREHFKRATREAALEGQFEGVRSELEDTRSQRQEAWGDVVAEARQSMPDFDSVFTPDVPVSDAMAELIMDSDMPAQIAYWLGKNRGEARRIAMMSPVEAAREIGRLEARVSPPKVKSVSSAPHPPTTVSGKAHQTMPPLEQDQDFERFQTRLLQKVSGR